VQPYVRLRAAVAEAAAQAVPVHSLTRSGASDAIAEFDMLASRLFPSMEAPLAEGPSAADRSSEAPSPEALSEPPATGDPIGASALVPGFR
jgi:hypothetical protein